MKCHSVDSRSIRREGDDVTRDRWSDGASSAAILHDAGNRGSRHGRARQDGGGRDRHPFAGVAPRSMDHLRQRPCGAVLPHCRTALREYLVREGYFPHWKLKTTGVIMPDEWLPWGQTIVSGLQHGVAMAGGTIIAPLIMGFDANLALLLLGVGTLIFFVVVAGRVPSYLGSSFSFIAVVIAATGYSGHGPNPNLDVALGGIIAAGVLYGIIALIVMQSGVSWIERLMPPAVTGAVVAAIGLNLAPVAVKSVSAANSTPVSACSRLSRSGSAPLQHRDSGADCRSFSALSADIYCICCSQTVSDW